MIFHRSRIKWSTITTPLLLNGITLERLSFTKFLGVIIDDKLSFIRHNDNDNDTNLDTKKTVKF